MAWPQKGKWSEEQTQVTFNPGLLSGDKNDAWSPKIGACPACLLSWAFICVVHHARKDAH